MKKSIGISQALIVASMGFLLLITLYPFWHLFMYTLSDPQRAALGGIFLWPRGFSLDAIKAVFGSKYLLTAYRNSILVTLFGTTVNMIMTLLLAYPLSIARFKPRTPITLFVFFTMLFNGGMIPNYLLVKALGLLNTFWALWLPGAISAWNMFIMRNYFKSLPSALEECASIDGASQLRIMLQIILPISAPIIASMALFYGVGHWNAYMNCILYIDELDMQVLQVFLRRMLSQAQEIELVAKQGGMPSDVTLTPESIKMATVLVSVVPVLIVYPFVQKYFVAGIIVGSIKG